MELVRAFILGVVQGLTEFIPVSSSGHLVLIPALFRWPDQGLAFDAGLHGGTLLALLIYFKSDWYRLLRGSWNGLRHHGVRFDRYEPDGRLAVLIALGTLPVGVIGLAFNGWIEDNLREVWIVTVALAGVALLMLAADRLGTRYRTVGDIGLRDAMVVGLAQAAALIPGVSRSGATISAAMALGLNRYDAARFAFLLGTPAFAGAALLAVSDLVGASDIDVAQMALGFVTSAAVGLLAIGILMRFLRTRTLVPFVLYRLGVAAAVLVIAAARGG